MYLQIGYSNGPIASGLTGSDGANSTNPVRVASCGYVDAVFVEIVPAASLRNDIGLTRAQAAIRLYSSIFNYVETATARLRVSA